MHLSFRALGRNWLQLCMLCILSDVISFYATGILPFSDYLWVTKGICFPKFHRAYNLQIYQSGDWRPAWKPLVIRQALTLKPISSALRIFWEPLGFLRNLFWDKNPRFSGTVLVTHEAGYLHVAKLCYWSIDCWPLLSTFFYWTISVY